MSVTESQFKSLLDEYEKIRSKNLSEARARKAELYARIPPLKEIDDKIADMSLNAARRYIDGSDNAFDFLSSDIEILSQKKKELLRDYGFSEDYAAVRYNCSDCQDTGYIDGKRCHCLTQRLVNRLYAKSNIMERVKTDNFQNFDMSVYTPEKRESMHSVYNAAINFIETFANSYHNMLFLGSVGSGKTYMSSCIAGELMNRGFSVLYFTAFQLFEMIGNYVFGRNRDKVNSELYESVFDSDLLIIDDLGTEAHNSFVNTQLFYILNERDIRRNSTLISSNLSLGSLQMTYSERSTSRILSGYDLYKFESKDIRLSDRI